MAHKKNKPAEKENAERWLLTYADLITLLLVLFIVLYSMAQTDTQKFQEMAESLAITFGGVGRSGVLDGGRSLVPGPSVSKERRAMSNTQERINRMIAQMGLQGKISVSRERGLVISIKDSVLFYSGSGELSGPAMEIVGRVARILQPMPNFIRVEGHTDTDRIHNTRFYSNWELSTSRATNVLQYLLHSGGISPDRLSAAGYGEYRPKAPNDTPENKAQNRRVDIVLMVSGFNKYEPKAENAGHSAPAEEPARENDE